MMNQTKTVVQWRRAKKHSGFSTSQKRVQTNAKKPLPGLEPAALYRAAAVSAMDDEECSGSGGPQIKSRRRDEHGEGTTVQASKRRSNKRVGREYYEKKKARVGASVGGLTI